jgi:hypothetical protein
VAYNKSCAQEFTPSTARSFRPEDTAGTGYYLKLTSLRRGRLVAYGARLESVLGASPRGFESLSLRQIKNTCLE